MIAAFVYFLLTYRPIRVTIRSPFCNGYNYAIHIYQNSLFATVATLLLSKTYAASIAMLSAASSWRFLAVKEKLVSSFIALR